MSRRLAPRILTFVPGLDASAASQNAATQIAAAVELPADARPSVVDRAEPRNRVQGDTRPIPALLQAAHAVVLHHEGLGHVIHAVRKFDRLVAAAPAAGAGGKIIDRDRGNGADMGTSRRPWRRFVSIRHNACQRAPV